MASPSSALSCVFRCPDRGHCAGRTGLEIVEKAALPPRRKALQLNSAEFLLEFCFRDKRGPEAIDIGSECQDCCSSAFSSSFLKPRREVGSDPQYVFACFQGTSNSTVPAGAIADL